MKSFEDNTASSIPHSLRRRARHSSTNHGPLCVAVGFASVLFAGVTFACPSLAGDETATQSDVITAPDNPFRVHLIRSPYQSGETRVRVLLPRDYDTSRKYRVLYVLPVEAGDGQRWGDGLAEVRRAALHERFQLICVAPTFSQLPWYADHPTDKTVWQESYLLKSVIPLVEKEYSSRGDRAGRLLVGFSKSGWGAITLLLRNPDVFEAAAAWDAPLMMEQFGQYGSGPIFGARDNFQSYWPSRLLPGAGESLGPQPRIMHLGYGNFREHHARFERLLNDRRVPHQYVDGPAREHAWGSGWLPEAVKMLMETVEPDAE